MKIIKYQIKKRKKNVNEFQFQFPVTSGEKRLFFLIAVMFLLFIINFRIFHAFFTKRKKYATIKFKYVRIKKVLLFYYSAVAKAHGSN